jgi:hypothetical protein
MEEGDDYTNWRKEHGRGRDNNRGRGNGKDDRRDH